MPLYELGVIIDPEIPPEEETSVGASSPTRSTKRTTGYITSGRSMSAVRPSSRSISKCGPTML
jgi:hypothetical protein